MTHRSFATPPSVPLLVIGLALAAAGSGCAADLAPLDVHATEDSADKDSRPVGDRSLADLDRGCSTAGTEGLSRQLLDEMECLSDGALVSVSHPNLVPTHSRVHLFLSPEGSDALLSVAATQRVEINSALRTIAEQYVLGRGCAVAAPPGRSNHETGRAIDVRNYRAVGPALESAGFARPLPSRDPVHYVAPGADLRHLSVLAFQTLWNANHPDDAILEDGEAGPQTRARLALAPAGGFGRAGVCRGGDVTPPEPLPPQGDPSGCAHSQGGAYVAFGCSAGYQCCDGSWGTRGSCGACACVEETGARGCGGSADPDPADPDPAPRDGVPSSGVTLDGMTIPYAGFSNPTLAGTGMGGTEPHGERVQFDGGEFVRGTISWFGGPDDTGVTPTETGTITGENLRALNSPLSPSPSQLADRPEDFYFVAMRWSYAPHGRSWLRDARVLVVDPSSGRAVVTRPVDWGPHTRTERIVDVSPQTVRDLGVRTDDHVLVSWAPAGTPLGPVQASSGPDEPIEPEPVEPEPVEPEPSPTECSDTCYWANDGECDDGGPQSAYDVCALGTDCADCGPRR